MSELITSLYDLLTHRAIHYADRTAIICGNERLSYGSLLEEVNAHGRQLEALGVTRGSRVGIHLTKSVEEIVATLSVAAAGAVFVNINYQWTERQLRHVLQDCNIRVLITDARKTRSLTSLIAENLLHRLVVVGGEGLSTGTTGWNDVPSIKNSVFEYAPISSDLAALLYTSGSTGAPKGVMVTHGNLLDGARIVCSYLNLEASDRILSVPPLNFDYGLNQLLDALWVGGTLVLHPVPFPREIVGSVNRYEITVLPLVAPSWVQLIQLLSEAPTELTTLRVATNTGGKIPKTLLEQVPKRLRGADFFLMYGLTEAFRSTYLPPALFGEKTGAIGKAIPNNEVFVVDPERGLCGPGEIGELIHRGCLVSRGYWGNARLTQERIRPNPHLRHLISDEPVVHSGDLVRFDEDGILWFEGRRDEMIKCSGFRISPTEVEEVVAPIEGITEAVAFGVDDAALGQVVHVAVAGEEGMPDEHKVIAICRKAMPSYMVPVRVHVYGRAMPRTTSGKLDRSHVVRVCLERYLGRVIGKREEQ